jgi:hypothetical protein
LVLEGQSYRIKLIVGDLVTLRTYLDVGTAVDFDAKICILS